jgi:transglutaminase-like putative cysteine protease
MGPRATPAAPEYPAARGATVARIRVFHKTIYRYREPVHFREHRFMCRPRDSHDLRLVDTGITIRPPARLRWVHDVFGNSVLVATFAEAADELVFESSFLADHYPSDPHVDLIEPYAETLPFSYDAAERADLACLVQRHCADPEHRLDDWVRAVCEQAGTSRTLEVLHAITCAIKDRFRYEARDEEGTRTPIETLEHGSGSCRDFALFMMEAVRSLGLAARFVSGYLYEERMPGSDSGVVGGGATHAWVQVYLPGAGWLPFDPTNAIIGDRNLIRVATARDPSQAAPLTGSYVGPAEAFLGLSVEVRVEVEHEAAIGDVAGSGHPAQTPG